MSRSEPEVEGEPLEALLIDAGDLAMVRARVRMRAVLLGLARDRAEDLVLAVHEIAVAAFAADPRPTLFLVSAAPGRVACEFRDPDGQDTPGHPAFVSRLTDPDMARGRGWRLAAALCDDVVRAADGTTISVTMRTSGAAPPAGAGNERSHPGH